MVENYAMLINGEWTPLLELFSGIKGRFVSFAEENWQGPNHGPQGGTYWINKHTQEIKYQQDNPGGKAAQAKPIDWANFRLSDIPEQKSRASKHANEIKKKLGDKASEKIAEVVKKLESNADPKATGKLVAAKSIQEALAGTKPMSAPSHKSVPMPSKTERPMSPRSDEEKPLLAPVTSVQYLGGGVNQSRIITMEGGARGVFKPVEGEYQGLREHIPNGTFHYREAAVAHVAGILGMDDLVPATTVREVDGKEGSVQAFVDKASIANAVANPFDGEKDHARAAAMDYLMAQSDRHPGNWMLTLSNKEQSLMNKLGSFFTNTIEGEKLKLIDNGLSLPSKEKTGHFQNQDLLREAVDMKIPDLSEWVGKRQEIEKSMRDNKIDDESILLAMKRFDEIVKASKEGKAFGDLPYAGMTVKQITAATPQGFRVKR